MRFKEGKTQIKKKYNTRHPIFWQYTRLKKVGSRVVFFIFNRESDENHRRRGITIYTHTISYDVTRFSIVFQTQKRMTVRECICLLQVQKRRANNISYNIVSVIWKNERKTERSGKNLHMVFIDRAKAYDCIPKDLIWQVLDKMSVSRGYINIFKDMYGELATIATENYLWRNR